MGIMVVGSSMDGISILDCAGDQVASFLGLLPLLRGIGGVQCDSCLEWGHLRLN